MRVRHIRMVARAFRWRGERIWPEFESWFLGFDEGCAEKNIISSVFGGGKVKRRMFLVALALPLVIGPLLNHLDVPVRPALFITAIYAATTTAYVLISANQNRWRIGGWWAVRASRTILKNYDSSMAIRAVPVIAGILSIIFFYICISVIADDPVIPIVVHSIFVSGGMFTSCFWGFAAIGMRGARHV